MDSHHFHGPARSSWPATGVFPARIFASLFCVHRRNLRTNIPLRPAPAAASAGLPPPLPLALGESPWRHGCGSEIVARHVPERNLCSSVESVDQESGGSTRRTVRGVHGTSQIGQAGRGSQGARVRGATRTNEFVRATLRPREGAGRGDGGAADDVRYPPRRSGSGADPTGSLACASGSDFAGLGGPALQGAD